MFTNLIKKIEMKNLILMFCMIAIFSCNKNEEKKDESGIMDTVEGIQNLNKATDALKGFEKRIEELKKLKPLSNEVYKNVFPESLDNLKRTNFNAGGATAMGLSSAEATYEVESPNKSLKINIIDGAGESGSAIVNMAYLTMSMDSESIQNTNTKKTETIDGIKCMTENDTDPNNKHSSITYLYKERYSITMEGNQMELDELKSFIKKIDFSKLD